MSIYTNLGQRIVDWVPEVVVDWVSPNHKIARIVEKALASVEQAKNEAPKKQWADTATLVLGDLFTLGLFGFNTALTYAPGLSSISSMVWASCICGEIAGAINIAVSLVSFKQAWLAYQAPGMDEKRKIEARRMILDGIFGIALGTVMILLSTSLKVGQLATVAHILSNPLVYPLLFLLSMCLIVKELALRETDFLLKKDFISSLNLNEWEMRLSNGDFTLPDFLNVNEEEKKNLDFHVIAKMSDMETNVGIEAALQITRVWLHTLKQNKEQALQEMTLLKQRAQEWTRTQHLRTLQQGLYGLGIIVSLLSFSPKINPFALNLINNGTLVGANGIALGLDSFDPFKRNTRITVITKEFAEGH